MKPEYIAIKNVQGFENRNKDLKTWGYEDVRMKGYKQAHTNLNTWGCKDANKDKWTWGYGDVRMWRYNKYTWT